MFNSLVFTWERNFEVTTFGIFSVLVFQINILESYLSNPIENTFKRKQNLPKKPNLHIKFLFMGKPCRIWKCIILFLCSFQWYDSNYKPHKILHYSAFSQERKGKSEIGLTSIFKWLLINLNSPPSYASLCQIQGFPSTWNNHGNMWLLSAGLSISTELS